MIFLITFGQAYSKIMFLFIYFGKQRAIANMLAFETIYVPLISIYWEMVPLKKSLKLDLKVAALVYLAGLHNK
jgi:hypothetical protein